MLLKDFLVISRANIQLASLPTAALGITLASTGGRDLFRPAVFLYVILFFILLTFACNLNCACDLNVDEKYKTHLSDAVRSLGIRRIKALLETEIAISLLLMAWLAALQRNILFLLAALGIIAGFAYSAPPLRIKKRGLISFFPVMGGLYFMPVVGGWFLVTERLSLFILLFAAGYAFLMQGITFVNTCEDYREDELSGIRTTAHVLGIRRTLSLGAGLAAAGGLLDICLLLVWKTDWRSLGTWRIAGIWIFSAVFITAVILIARRLYFLSRSADALEASKKSAVKMPLWFLLTRYSLWAVSLLAMNPHSRLP